MARRAADLFIGWVMANPQLALTLAFEVGKLAATISKHPGKTSAVLRSAVARSLPDQVPDAVARILAPPLQPGAKRKPRPKRKKTKPAVAPSD